MMKLPSESSIVLFMDGIEPKPGASGKSPVKRSAKSIHNPTITISGTVDKMIGSCEIKGDFVINVNSSVPASDLLEAIDRITAALPESERNDARKTLLDCLA